MTKYEAMKAMQDGKKVRHGYFDDNEWMKRHSPGYYQFEDDVVINQSEFWSIRNSEAWNQDWEIVEDENASNQNLPEPIDDDSEIEFPICDNCDLPDACADYGCAIKSGVRKITDNN